MRLLAASLLFLGLAGPAYAQAKSDPAPSRCLAIAENLKGNGLPVMLASLAAPLAVQAAAPEVTITYAGHSTYVIETPAGVRIATDYSGWHGNNPLPRVVTMNRAHSTHYTMNPDPGIEHVLQGWKDGGDGAAEHRLVVEDVYIRNVPTDIRMGDMMMENGNSIFIFEVANLCIGHLGHLHHKLENAHYAAIGRLDVLMVPVDGGLTLSHDAMSEIVKRLQSSVVLPMHRRYTTIDRFLSRVAGDFAIEFLKTDTMKVSVRTLPRRPTIMVPPGL